MPVIPFPPCSCLVLTLSTQGLRAPLGGLEDPTQLEVIRVPGTGSGWEAGSAHCGRSRKLPGPPSREASHPVLPWPRVAHGSPRKIGGRARAALRSFQIGSGSACRPRPRARAPPNPRTQSEQAGMLRLRAGALPPTASGSAARPRPPAWCVRASGPRSPAAPPPAAASAGPSGFAGGPHRRGPARPGPAAHGPPRAPAAAAPPPRLLRAPPGTTASAPAGRGPESPGAGRSGSPRPPGVSHLPPDAGSAPCELAGFPCFRLVLRAVCSRGSPCYLGHLYQRQPGGGRGPLGRCSQPRPSAGRFFLGHHMGAGYPAGWG